MALFRDGLRRGVYLALVVGIALPAAIIALVAALPIASEEAVKQLSYSGTLGSSYDYTCINGRFVLAHLRSPSSGREAECLANIIPDSGKIGVILGVELARILDVKPSSRLEVCFTGYCFSATVIGLDEKRGQFFTAIIFLASNASDGALASPSIQGSGVCHGKHGLMDLSRALGIEEAVDKIAPLLVALYTPLLPMLCKIVIADFRKTLIALRTSGLEAPSLATNFSLLVSILVFASYVYGVGIGIVVLHLFFTLAPVIGMPALPTRPLPPIYYTLLPSLGYASFSFAYCIFSCRKELSSIGIGAAS